jgi:predicted GNAT family acetyltransferase
LSTPDAVIVAEERMRDEGIVFEYCYDVYRERFLAFFGEHFWPSWVEHNQRYVERGGDPRERVLAILDDHVVGFVNFAATGAVGQIRKTGVLPSLCGKGIGSVLVYRAIEELRSMGATELFIAGCPWGFYRITEGRITRTRVQLRKSIDGAGGDC